MFSFDQTKRFLEALGSKLPDDNKFTFQTFGDGKHRKKIKDLRRIRHGTLDEHIEELTALNKKGAGIFVTINLTDLKGREEENIIGLRAAFVDADNIDLLQIFDDNPNIELCYPNIITKSKRGLHAYWLLDRWEKKELFTPLQAALIEEFKTDPEIKDLSRVMRLPGFYHMKDEPIELCSDDDFERSINEGRASLVTLEHLNTFCNVEGFERDGSARDGNRRGWTVKEIQGRLNLTIADLTPKYKKQNIKTAPVTTHFPPEFRLYLAKNYLYRIAPPTKGTGDAHVTVGSACRVGHDFGVDSEVFWPHLLEWGSRCTPPFVDKDLRYEYETFLKATKYPAGTKLQDSEYDREKQYKNWQRAQGFDVAAVGEIYRDDEVPWSGNAPSGASNTKFTKAKPPSFDRGDIPPFAPTLPPDSNPLNSAIDPIDEHMLKDEEDRLKRALNKKQEDKKKQKQKRQELSKKGPAYLVWADHGEPPDFKKTKDGRAKVKPAYHRDVSWHYLSSKCKHDEFRTLHFYNDEFFEWDGISYNVYKPKIYRKKVASFLTSCAEENGLDSEEEPIWIPYKVNSSRKKEILEALEDMVHLDLEETRKMFEKETDKADNNKNRSAPCWLVDTEGLPDPREVIVCKNGLFDIRNRKLLPSTPAYFSNNYISVNYDPDAPKPKRWLRFLDEVFPDDEESKRLLKWWFGYCMTEDTRQQRLLMMVGRPRSGKGTCMHVLKMLVGNKAFGSMNFKALGSTFGLSSAINKSVLVFADSRVGTKTDQAAIVECLLGISGEDDMYIDRKNLPQLNTQLKCRLILVSNEVLNLHDTSGALESRILMIRFTEEFKDLKESKDKLQDKQLKSKLESELPGILNWAIEGWHELQLEGRFFEPSSSEELIRTFSAQSSPTNQFLDQCCLQDKENEINTDTLFKGWTLWCKSQGYKEGNQANLGKSLMSLIPYLIKSRRSESEDMGRPRYYKGIKLNDVWTKVVEDHEKHEKEMKKMREEKAKQSEFNYPGGASGVN